MNNIKYREDRFTIKAAIQENFGCEDSILVSDKFYRSLDEAQTLAVGDMVTGRAMAGTQKQLAKLNQRGVYGDIPKTKGDVSKTEYYKTVKSSITLLENFLPKAKGPNASEALKCFEGCKFAIDNLERNKAYFQNAYRTNDTKLILLYQNIYAGTIIMLAVLCINSVYINDKFEITYMDCKKGTYDKNKLMKQIYKFNDMCRNKKLPELNKFNEVMEEFDLEEFTDFTEAININIGGGYKDAYKASMNPEEKQKFRDRYGKGFSGIANAIQNHGVENPRDFKNPSAGAKVAAGLAMAGIVGGVAALTILMVRGCIMLFFYLKNDVSDYANYLGDVVYANSLAHEYDKSGEVARKQKALSAKLKQVGSALDSDFKQAEHNASIHIKADDTKTSDQLTNTLNPDNANTFDGDDLFI